MFKPSKRIVVRHSNCYLSWSDEAGPKNNGFYWHYDRAGALHFPNEEAALAAMAKDDFANSEPSGICFEDLRREIIVQQINQRHEYSNSGSWFYNLMVPPELFGKHDPSEVVASVCEPLELDAAMIIPRRRVGDYMIAPALNKLTYIEVRLNRAAAFF